jgi:PHP domain
VIRIQGRWTPDDRAEAFYRYLPFEVPAGVAAVTVRYAFELAPDSVLDLGLFDAGAFRGWSGADRHEVIVTAEAATPGYLSGPLVPGEWRIMFGLQRVPAAGLAWTVEIDLGPARPEPLPAPPPRPERPMRRDLPSAPGRRWLAGDFHSHSVHSDGVLTPTALACLAAERGLDFLAVTDHNVVAHHPELPAAGAHAGILLLPGQEVTTDKGHANALGAMPWIDFRGSSDEWLAAVEAGGGLMSINHPLYGDCRWRRPMTRHPPLAEVWHHSWDRRNPAPLEWWSAWGGVPVGGSDYHYHGHGGLPGQPTTWVEAADLSLLAVSDALRAGRVAISAEPDGPVVVRHDGEVVVLDGDGATLIDPLEVPHSVVGPRRRYPGVPGLYRLVDADGLTLALVP